MTARTTQIVLITGGAKGVGLGISRSFLARGAQVIITARNAPENPVEVDGNQAEFIAADIRDAEACKALLADIAARHGRLDVLINNAGGSPFAMADAASPRFHEAIIRLNLLAPLNLAQGANALMQQQDHGGVIINIGSVSADRASPGTAAYGAAKAGLLNLTQSLAVEWAPKVRVAAVSPGPVLTEQAHLHFGDEAGIAAVASSIPMQRLAQPDDIGNACVWLASDQAAYVSGSNIVINGGGERPAFLDKATVNKT
ncbi:short chain dehydrogenase [Oceanococcus atlanticus]|uniref:Short chain dehydrogenase n=1 Tax=Oceanococcus atlanticus TaxID=1317117 RepID=A0A1Y1SGG9_9GAMM|nr:SDR family oxidoreductase [Oceanococcus atlanticus]ORE88753.1 short chain dehydrogenase [Oceanococcus atlanticus]